MKSVVVDGSYTHTLNIPDEWEFSELKNVINLVGGNQPPKSKFLYEASDNTIRLIQIRDYKSDQHKVFIQKSDAKRFVNKTDVMIGRYGPPIFQILRGLEGAYNVALMKAEPVLGSYDKDFLYYYLSNQDIYNYVNSASDRTAGQSGVNKEHLEKYPVPVVPLAEQQEIVRQLDVMLAQVEQIKVRLDAIPAILKKFRQSVLADAVSGKLINQDFSSLGFLKLESLILDSGNGLSKRKGDSGNEVTVLRLADFKDAQRVFGNERSILLTEKELLKYKLLQNDILVVRVNGSVDIAGKFILHKDNEKDKAYCDHFIRLRIDQQKLLPEYLLYIANEGSGRDYLVNSLSTSAGQNTINQASIKGLQLRVPEIKYQDMIVQTVEKLFKHSFKIEETVLSAQKRVNLLTQSILAKAFSGELTAEWREQHQDLITGVNSAEALLVKIQEEREASKPVKKTRKKKEV